MKDKIQQAVQEAKEKFDFSNITGNIFDSYPNVKIMNYKEFSEYIEELAIS